jgi:hypothetical protein
MSTDFKPHKSIQFGDLSGGHLAAYGRRYPGNITQAMSRTYDTEEALAAGYFEMARSMFLSDGHYDSTVFLFRERKLIQVFPAAAEDQLQIHLRMWSLAREAFRIGADAAIMVTEVWCAAPSDLEPNQRPTELPTRQEALLLLLVSRDGQPVNFLALIKREGNAVSLEEFTVESADVVLLAPFYRVWGRPIPETWS